MTKRITVDDFKVDTTLLLPQRVASFLHWGAEKLPRQFFRLNIITKAVMGYARTPRDGSDEVLRMRRTVSASTKFLVADYERSLINDRVLGYRASVDSADTLVHALPGRVSRYRAAATAVQTTVGIIDAKSIPNTAALQPWKQWLDRDVGAVMKQLNDPSYFTKLLPPAPEAKKE